MSAERDLKIAEAVLSAARAALFIDMDGEVSWDEVDFSEILDNIPPEPDAIDAARYRALRAELMSNEDGPVAIAHTLARIAAGPLNNGALTLDKFDTCADIGMAMSALADPPKWKCRDCGNGVDSDHRGCV